MSLILNKKLAVTIEQSEIEALHSRLRAIGEISGNPMGVEIQRFGNATAFSVKNIPGPSFNTVKGLTDGDEEFVESIINYYSNKQIPVRFELTPAHVSTNLFTLLSKEGFYQSDFHTALYGSLHQNRESMDSPVVIRKLNKQEFDTFAAIYVSSFQLPAFLKDGVARNNEVLYDNENWTFYLASINNEPAGIGVLFIKDGIANLAAAATLPHFRNQGIQNALIKKRIDQAIVMNCKIVVGQAKFGSVSQNNMERAGMKIAYTKAIWIQR